MTPTKSPARTVKALLALASLAITLLLLEVGLSNFSPVRFMAPPDPDHPLQRERVHQASSIPGLPYELAPNKRTVYRGIPLITNPNGLRDEEPRTGDASPRVVIAAVGDSFTFGLGVRGREAWGEALERRLNAGLEARPFSVLNFGVGAYSSRDEVLVIEHKVLERDPSLLIVGYVLNDPEIDAVQPLQRSFSTPAWWQHWNVMRLAAWLRRQATVLWVGGGDYLRHLHATDREKWQSVVTVFARIGELARQRDLPVLVAVFPLNWKATWEEYDYADLHQQVLQEAERNGLAGLDLLDDFRRHPVEAVRIADQDPHPSPLGHGVAAAAIEQWIREHTDLVSIATRDIDP